MDTKGREARFIAEVLAGAVVAKAAGASWQVLSERSRQDAATVMAEGGKKILLDRFIDGEISGVIGLGGANGTSLVCSIMRALPYLVPKIMVSTVAGTAAAQWYVAESDVAMYPSIGDLALNRITRSVMENAALAVAAAARNWTTQREAITEQAPLVAVSSFGGTARCVDRVSERLEKLGYEVIQFHASGVGGKSLERLAVSG